MQLLVGVVYPNGETDEDKVLKGVIRVEYLKQPSSYIKSVLDRVNPKYISKVYGISEWTGPEQFLQKLAHSSGKLLKGNSILLSIKLNE